ncbi:hypothetical protein [Accumulibacter sp.]|uniref:hypothetical protein n=1 Tax=Accumulibacter sp. TaxID=2053492 RepID=UPI00262754A5|nr:hypothetical protein [Accumulibacter sp.]
MAQNTVNSLVRFDGRDFIALVDTPRIKNSNESKDIAKNWMCSPPKIMDPTAFAEVHSLPANLVARRLK